MALSPPFAHLASEPSVLWLQRQLSPPVPWNPAPAAQDAAPGLRAASAQVALPAVPRLSHSQAQGILAQPPGGGTFCVFFQRPL